MELDYTTYCDECGMEIGDDEPVFEQDDETLLCEECMCEEANDC